jgi:hypothetical protein
MVFSDGTEMEVQTVKTGDAQYFQFDKKRISWIKLTKFKISEEPALFAALIELEVYGSDIRS